MTGPITADPKWRFNNSHPNRSGSATVSDVDRGPFRWHPVTPRREHDSIPSRPLHVPIVPMSVKVPVAPSMLYIETSFEPEFVT